MLIQALGERRWLIEVDYEDLSEGRVRLRSRNDDALTFREALAPLIVQAVEEEHLLAREPKVRPSNS